MTFRPETPRPDPKTPFPLRIVRSGPAAFYVQLETPVGEEVSRYLARLRRALEPWPAGVRDVVPGYRSLLVEHDPNVAQAQLGRWLFAALPRAAEPAADPGADPAEETRGRIHTVRVCYGDEADRDALESRLGLPWDEIVRLHSGATYTVAFIGFTPGFPYLLGLPEALRTPRRETPRARVPEGAVAMADGQAGIYPAASPGGWWVLGRTDARLYTPRLEPPTLLAPGDTVRFHPVDELADPDAADPDAADPDTTERAPALIVERVWPGSASVQAAPRWGVGHVGQAQAGALDPVALEAANALVGNAKETAAVELLAQPLELLAAADLVLAVTGGGFRLELGGRAAATWRAHDVRRGQRVALIPDPKARGYTSYLALRGGLAAEVYRGSASTDARGRVGGYGGRWLLPGDQLASAGLAAGPGRDHPGRPRYPERITLRVFPGPQYDEAAFAMLVGSSFRLTALDRMGARLSALAAKPRVALEEITSEGSPWGAVQLPPAGEPIILLADRGRTGGYAKPAVVHLSDLWQVAQARPGTEVWFTPAS